MALIRGADLHGPAEDPLGVLSLRASPARDLDVHVFELISSLCVLTGQSFVQRDRKVGPVGRVLSVHGTLLEKASTRSKWTVHIHVGSATDLSAHSAAPQKEHDRIIEQRRRITALLFSAVHGVDESDFQRPQSARSSFLANRSIRLHARTDFGRC